MLRHLVSKGVFRSPSPGRFELSETAKQLMDPRTRLALDLDGFGGRSVTVLGQSFFGAVESARVEEPVSNARLSAPVAVESARRKNHSSCGHAGRRSASGSPPGMADALPHERPSRSAGPVLEPWAATPERHLTVGLQGQFTQALGSGT
jgi:hypothetical protein